MVHSVNRPLDSHLTTYCSSIVVQIIVVFDLDTSTLGVMSAPLFEQWTAKPDCYSILHMNQLSLRNNRLKFKTSKKGTDRFRLN